MNTTLRDFTVKDIHDMDPEDGRLTWLAMQGICDAITQSETGLYVARSDQFNVMWAEQETNGRLRVPSLRDAQLMLLLQAWQKDTGKSLRILIRNNKYTVSSSRNAKNSTYSTLREAALKFLALHPVRKTRNHESYAEGGQPTLPTEPDIVAKIEAGPRLLSQESEERIYNACKAFLSSIYIRHPQIPKSNTIALKPTTAKNGEKKQ